MDRKALIGLLSGVLVVIATLIGVGLLNARQAEGAPQPASGAPHDCAIGSKSADKTAEPGYGSILPDEACARAY